LNAMCCWSMKSLSQFCLKVSLISARNGVDGLGWFLFLFWGGWGAKGTCGPDGSVNCQMFTQSRFWRTDFHWQSESILHSIFTPL
jgi:hypothetical protein